jgi:hypothetical protein
MSDEASYTQPDKDAVLLDIITDFMQDEFTMLRSIKYELYFSTTPNDQRQTGFEGFPVFEIRFGEQADDYVRVNITTAMFLILKPEKNNDAAVKRGILLQHAVLKAIEKKLVDAASIGRALARSFIAGEVGTDTIGELLASNLYLFNDHPQIVAEQNERDEYYYNASMDDTAEIQYKETVDEINRRDRAEGYKLPSDRVASGELEPGEEGFEDYIDEMAAKYPGEDE